MRCYQKLAFGGKGLDQEYSLDYAQTLEQVIYYVVYVL